MSSAGPNPAGSGGGVGTPLRRARGLGAAGDGTTHFWRQRLTAVANIPLVLFALFAIATHAGDDYDTVRGFFSWPPAAIAMLLLIVSGTWHMRLGMQVIIEDYVHHAGWRIAALMGNVFFCAAAALAAGLAVLRLLPGG